MAEHSQGVSVGLFCAVEKHLRKTYKGKAVCVGDEMLNRWIGMLGQIEDEYRELRDAKKAESE